MIPTKTPCQSYSRFFGLSQGLKDGSLVRRRMLPTLSSCPSSCSPVERSLLLALGPLPFALCSPPLALCPLTDCEHEHEFVISCFRHSFVIRASSFLLSAFCPLPSLLLAPCSFLFAE